MAFYRSISFSSTDQFTKRKLRTTMTIIVVIVYMHNMYVQSTTKKSAYIMDDYYINVIFTCEYPNLWHTIVLLE